MNRFFFLCMLAGSMFSQPSVVLVHLGKELPTYIPETVAQIRTFNPDCPIYLVASQEAIQHRPSALHAHQVDYIACEALKKSKFHEHFSKSSALDKKFRNGFWTFTTERFFYLYAFIKEKNLEDVIHLENDVMLYIDLNEIIPTLKKYYKGMIAATFDNDKRCIPGFLYISNLTPLERLIDFISRRAEKGGNDMEFLAGFKARYHKKWIDHLPILMSDYSKQNELTSAQGHKGLHAEDYSQHIDEFRSIFDAAAIGQYLGGIDPIHGLNTVGFINESCIFNPSKWSFEWVADAQGRKVPYAIYNGQKWKINNLHIHSKNLVEFRSK